MKALWFCLAVTLLPGPVLQAQHVSLHAQKAVETIRELRRIGLPDPPDNDDSNPAPPARVPGLLRLLNQELKALIIEDLNDSNRHTHPTAKEIFDQLTAAGWEEIPSHKWNAYGEIRDIKFGGPDLNHDFLAVSTQLWVPCADDPDSAVYVFHLARRTWDLVLSAEADFNAGGGDDQSGLQYKISKPDAQGRWFLVVANVPLSCRNGAARVLRYKALRPGVSPDQPTVLVSGRQTLNPFFDEPFRIDVDAYTFAVTQGIERKLDGEPGIAISKFGVSGDKTRRIAPIALTAEDFLDQWVQMAWDEAKQWTNASRDSDLQEWHAKLNGLAADSAEIESAQRCSTAPDGDENWLLQLAIDQPPNPSIGEENLYIEVTKRDEIFLVDRVLKAHPSGCPGKTPPTVVLNESMPGW